MFCISLPTLAQVLYYYYELIRFPIMKSHEYTIWPFYPSNNDIYILIDYNNNIIIKNNIVKIFLFCISIKLLRQCLYCINE